MIVVARKCRHATKQQWQRSRAVQRGLSLVELMIAIALGLFLTWGATQAFLSGKRTYTMQEAMSRMQENTRMAQELLGFDIRNAGNYGCASGKYVASGTNSNALPSADKTKAEFDFANSVFGSNDVAGDASGGMSLATALSPAPKAGTDILVVHTGTNLGVDVLTVSPAAPGPATQITTSNGGVTTADIIAVSDCAKSIIFKPASVSTAGTVVTLNYIFPVSFYPSVGSTLMRLDTAIYYVAINPATNRSSLYRRLLNGNSEELLQGVEDMQLQFGLDSTGNDGQVDSFVTANAVTAAQWSAWGDGGKLGTTDQNVVAVRYSLLLSSDNELLETPKQYTYNGVATTAPDRRLRQIVNGTVGLRSRLN